LFGIGSTPTIEIKIDGLESRKHITVKDKDGKSNKLPLFLAEDDISGNVEINIGKNKRLEHQGIRIEIVGRVECFFDKNQSSDFMSMSRELEPVGILTDDKNYKFAFNKFEKQYETYSGTGFKLRYFLRVTINRNYVPKIVKEFDFAVFLPTMEPDENKNIKMEVGIEECLHIEFEYNKGKYHLKDCVVGKVYFLLVRIKIKYMELAILRRETIGSGTTSQTENETVGKFEVMDGCPSKGEVIPIRLYMGAYDLTPTYKNINNKFSVKYFINLVLVDEEDRRYFKQQEITLWRRKWGD